MEWCPMNSMDMLIRVMIYNYSSSTHLHGGNGIINGSHHEMLPDTYVIWFTKIGIAFQKSESFSFKMYFFYSINRSRQGLL